MTFRFARPFIMRNPGHRSL